MNMASTKLPKPVYDQGALRLWVSVRRLVCSVCNQVSICDSCSVKCYSGNIATFEVSCHSE